MVFNTNKSTIYVATLGYYPGEMRRVKRENALNRDHIAPPLFITSQDLKKATLHKEDDDSYKIRKIKDNEELKKLSRERIKNWDNTIAGLRRTKLLAREKRLQKEEDERLKIDAEYARAEEQARAESIRRARLMLYNERDIVKAFNTKMKLHQTLHERDLQVKLQKSRDNYEEKLDLKYMKLEEMERRAALVEEHKRGRERRERNMEIAQAQKEQVRARKEAEELEKQGLVAEQAQLTEKVEYYKNIEKEKERRRQHRDKDLHSTLLKMQRENQAAAEYEKELDALEHENANGFQKFKYSQRQMINKVIEEKQSECIRAREKISETHRKLNTEAEARVLDQYIKGCRAAYEKEQAAEMKKLEVKRARQAEMTAFLEKHHNHLREEAENNRLSKEQRTREEQKLYAESVAEKQEEKNRQLESGKALQSFHIQQIKARKIAKAAAKAEINNYYAEQNSRINDEEIHLIDYMQSVEKEPWARSNPRLLSYVHEEIRKAKFLDEQSRQKPSLESSGSSTGLRLGFSGRWENEDKLPTLTAVGIAS